MFLSYFRRVFDALVALGLRAYLTGHRKGRRWVSHPTFIAMTILILVLWLWIGRSDQPATITLTWSEARYTVSEDFLGVAIDAAMLTDGEWWEDADDPPRPLIFDDQLTYWGQLLRPAWVRLGGTEADKLWLTETDEPTTQPSLSQAQLQQYLAFTDRIGARPFITVSAGPAVRQGGQWQPEQLDRLLRWLPDTFNGHLEFGNEPGAHWLIFGRQHQVRFDQLAEEYSSAQQRVHQRGLLLAGPANAFWPEIGEPLKQIFGSSKDFLQAGAKPDIFTWHYYPTQSSRCGVKTEGADWDGLLDSETQREFAKHSRAVRRWLQQYSPESKQWLGETGPAQCGGKARLTDRFGASLWWLSHLGIAAEMGNQTVIRQSLVGGDYALLRYRDGYSPNPDYWASLLWLRLMGPVGLPVNGQPNKTRAIAHCHPAHDGRLSIVVVNMGDRAIKPAFPQVRSAQYIDVTSAALDSRYTFIQGRLAETYDWSEADSLPWQTYTQQRPLPPYAYRWLVVDEVPACQSESPTTTHG